MIIQFLLKLTKFRLIALITFLLLITPTTEVCAKAIEVRVTVACDEEWITLYNEHWKQAALNAIEEADKALVDQFGINLYVHKDSYFAWDSNDLELNLSDLLDEAANEIGVHKTDDILITFSGQKTDFVGMAYVKGNACIVMHQNPVYDGLVTRHEVSHLFGCLDENPPAKSIMSEWWDYPNKWSKGCFETITKNRERFRN